MTAESIIFALIATAVLTFSLWLSAFLTNRAMFKVIASFCRNNALKVQGARTIDELDLNPPSFLQRLTQMRDYKPYALKILIQQGIVKTTPEGKLYLIEEKLNPIIRCDGLAVLPR